MKADRSFTVLVANRGEIAVRILRGAKECGYRTVAVYADADFDALFVHCADEAYALGGQNPRDSYLNIDAIIDIARRSGADAVHPGYGFLAENADFAEAVIDAGLVWIGPPPAAIRALGDKVTARRIATEVGAPMAAGTLEPVSDVAEVFDFADKWGLPIAIKAAYGGGGRGLKVATTREEIPNLLESATREAISAFGRGDCFVEQYLDRARHIEVQVLADQHGNVAVVGTRDCSLQRRFQKLVEEAPAPYLSDSQIERLRESAVAICRATGYVSAGTVEYLLQGDTISFLEVNTRLQVEHPVTEETAGIDIVREQFRIAFGEVIDYSVDLRPQRHSFEFRINAEDPGREFLPATGRLAIYSEPSGAGIRVDTGVAEGDVIAGEFDSMLAKLIVTGETRQEALERARLALDKFQIEGIPTVLPFHRLAVNEPDFIGDESGFGVHTKWIEEQWSNPLEPQTVAAPDRDEIASKQLRTTWVEIDKRRIQLRTNSALFGPEATSGRTTGAVPRARPVRRKRRVGLAAFAGKVIAPMNGTVVRLEVHEGQEVEEGTQIAVLEAMKMEYPVTAPISGVITSLERALGDAVNSGDAIATMEARADEA